MTRTREVPGNNRRKVDCKLCEASTGRVFHSVVAKYIESYLNRIIRVSKQEFPSFEITIQI